MFKKENGITLVALVITIIVLLILAGVSISLVLGDNGVLSQATKSKDKTALAQVQEAISTSVAGCQGSFTTDVYTDSPASKFSSYLTATRLNTELNKSGYKILAASDDFTTAVTDTNVNLYGTFYIAEKDATSGSTVYQATLSVNSAATTFDVTFDNSSVSVVK